MADNTVLNTMSGGDTISTDDIGGIKVQRMKVQYGSDGTATDVDTTTPLPVTSTDLAALVTLVTDEARVTHELLFRILTAIDKTSTLNITEIKET